jgi:hypothetical protein
MPAGDEIKWKCNEDADEEHIMAEEKRVGAVSYRC